MGVPPRAEFLCLLSCSRTRHFPSQMFFCLLASNPLGIPDDLPKGEYEYHLKQQPHFAAWLTSSQPTTLESPILYHAKINHFTFCDTSWLKQLKSFPFLYFHQNSTITQNFLHKLAKPPHCNAALTSDMTNKNCRPDKFSERRLVLSYRPNFNLKFWLESQWKCRISTVQVTDQVGTLPREPLHLSAAD